MQPAASSVCLFNSTDQPLQIVSDIVSELYMPASGRDDCSRICVSDCHRTTSSISSSICIYFCVCVILYELLLEM